MPTYVVIFISLTPLPLQQSFGALVFPRKLPPRLPAFLAVWRGQPEPDAALADLKDHAAPLFVMYLLTMLRSVEGVGCWLVLIFCLIFISWTRSCLKNKSCTIGRNM